MARVNKAFLILVLPVVVLIWSVGWFFYLIGLRKESVKSGKLSCSGDLEVFVLTPEERQTTRDTHYETVEAWEELSGTILYGQNLLVFKERTQLLRHRNKYDILALILDSCRKQPRSQSWLVRHLGIPSSSAKKFVNFLIAAKLIEANKRQEQKTYTTTARGKKALKHYIALTAQYFSI